VVGESQGWHVQLRGPDYQVLYPTQAIEQGVFAVHVEMNKRGHETLLIKCCLYYILKTENWKL